MHTIDLADVSTECDTEHHQDCTTPACECGCHHVPDPERFSLEPGERP